MRGCASGVRCVPRARTTATARPSRPDLHDAGRTFLGMAASHSIPRVGLCQNREVPTSSRGRAKLPVGKRPIADEPRLPDFDPNYFGDVIVRVRSEEHTSELQSLMRISYAVFCLKKKNTNI